MASFSDLLKLVFNKVNAAVAAEKERLIQEQLRQEAARQEAARQEQLRQEQLRQEQLRQEQLRQEAARQEPATQNLIISNFANIYNNNNLTTQQKAQQINQFAQQNNISRDEIASAMNLGANDLNAFLDTDPAIVQNRVNNLLQTATTEIKYDDPRYTRFVRDDEGNLGYVWNEAYQQLQQEKQEASRQLEALGYEWFDSKWLSPQEAASVTGTKVNNQLRNQAYIQSTENLASQLSPLANQLRQRLNAINASGNLVVNQPARYYNEVANRLTQQTGITDLNDVGVRKLEGRWIELGGDPPEARFFRTGSNQGELYDKEIYNKKTGQVYGQGDFINLGTFGNKQDETSAFLSFGPDGNIKLDAHYAYEQEAWRDVVTALAPIALNFVPGVGQFLGAAILPAGTSAAIQTAVGNAVLKAGIDVATGVPVETALKNGLVSVGINQGIPNLSDNVYIDNAVKAVSVAALTGGDVEAALVNSVISTGGKEALGNVSLTGDKVVDSAIASAVTSGLSAAATGGDVGASVAQGFGSGLSAGINTQNQVTTIPGVPAQTITGAAGNDSIPTGVGVDTVGGIAGADTVNAGVAENDVLDLIQKDIDTSVANNVQGNLNAEQEIQSATPVEPGTSDFTIPGGTTVGEFAEPGTGGFSRAPVVTTPPATSTTATDAGGGRGSAAGKTAEQEAKLNQIAQDLAARRAATPSVSDNAVIDYSAVSPESNAQGLSGTRADKIFETTARYVAAPALKGVGELIELGGVGYGALTGDRNNAAQQLGQRISTQGRNITLQQVLDEQKDIRNAIKNAPDVFGTLSDNLAAEQLNYENIGAFDPNVTQSEIDTSMTLANKAVAGTIAAVNNPVGFGDWVLTELFQEPLPLGLGVVAGKTAQAVAKSDAFNRFAAKTLGVNVSDDAAKIGLAGAVTTSVATNAAEAGLTSYKDVFDELKSRNFPDDYAHEQASKAFAVSAGTTLAVGAFVDKSLLEPFFSGANTSLNKRLGTQAVTGTLTQGVEAAGQGAGEQYFTDGKIDYEKLTDKIVLEALVGTGSNVSAQLGTNVIADKPAPTALPADGGTVLPSTPPPSNSGVVVAVDPDTNQASVIDDGGNITIIPAENLTPGQNIALPSTPVDTSPVVDQPVVDQPVVTAPSVTQPEVTAPIDTGPVVSTPIDTEPVVTEPVVTEPPIAQPVITQPVVTTPPVLTPEQIAAQELDAEVQKIMRMAVKKDPVDMRYDLNKDGRVNVIDALALKRGQATVPTVEEYQASLAQQTVAPQPGIAEPPITQPAVTEPVTQEPITQDIVTTAPSTTPSVTQPVEQTPSVEPPSPPPIVEPTPPTSEVTGIVLQNNGDGTALVLTNDGNASIVSDVDNNTGGTLTTGSSVVVDNNTGTASSTGTGTGTGVSDTATGATTGATTAVDTSGAVTAGTGVTTGATTGDTTGATTGAVTGVTTGDQVDTGGTQVLPEITTVGGTTSTDSTGTSTLTPGINVELPETIGGGTAVEDNVSGGGGNDLIVGGGSNDVIAGETTGTTTEEDLLLEQIIKELESTAPPVSEGVPIPEPVLPEPPLVLPKSPTINVGDRLAVRPVVDRGYRRPSVSPGSRVEESTQILPIRPGLSEGGTDGIEGTTEQEQEPVWNVRSLKLRRLLGI